MITAASDVPLARALDVAMTMAMLLAIGSKADRHGHSGPGVAGARPFAKCMVPANAAASSAFPMKVRSARPAGSRQSRSRGTGWEFVYVCIDDASRLAFSQILPDEKKHSAVAFLRAAVAYYQSLGVTRE